MYVRVTVRPGARKESVIRTEEAIYSISVREPAERNLANSRVRELLAEEFSLPVGKVQLLSGHRSPKKLFSIG